MAFSLTGILCREMTACFQRHLLGQKAVLLRRIRPIDLSYRVRFLAGSSGNDVRDFGELTSQSHRVGLSQTQKKLAKEKPIKDPFPFVTKGSMNPVRPNGLKSKLKHTKGIAASSNSSFAKSLRKSPVPNVIAQAFKDVRAAGNDVNIFINESLTSRARPENNVLEELRIGRGQEGDGNARLRPETADRISRADTKLEGKDKKAAGEEWDILASRNGPRAKKSSSKKLSGAGNKSGILLENELANKDTVILDRSQTAWNKTRAMTEVVKGGESGDVPLGLAFVSRDNKTTKSSTEGTARNNKTHQFVSDLQDGADIISKDLCDSDVTSTSMGHSTEKALVTDDGIMGSKLRTAADKDAEHDWPSYFNLYNSSSFEKSEEVAQSWMPKAWLELEQPSGQSERQRPFNVIDGNPMKGYKRQWEINEEDFMVNGTGMGLNLSSNPESHRMKERLTEYRSGAREKDPVLLHREYGDPEKGTNLPQNSARNEVVQREDGRKSVPQPLLYVTPRDLAKGKPGERPDGESMTTGHREERIVEEIADKLGVEAHARNKLPKSGAPLNVSKAKEKKMVSNEHLEVSFDDIFPENMSSRGKTFTQDIGFPQNKSTSRSQVSKQEDGGRPSPEPLLYVTAQEIAKAKTPLDKTSVRTHLNEEASKTDAISGYLNASEETVTQCHADKDQTKVTEKDEGDVTPAHWYLDYISLHEREAYAPTKTKDSPPIKTSTPRRESAQENSANLKPSVLVNTSARVDNASLGFVKHTPQPGQNSDDPTMQDSITRSPDMIITESLNAKPLNELLCCEEQPALFGSNQSQENRHLLPKSQSKSGLKGLSAVPTAIKEVNSDKNLFPRNSDVSAQKPRPSAEPIEPISEDFLWLTEKICDGQNPSFYPKADVKTKFNRDALKTYAGQKVTGIVQSPLPPDNSCFAERTLPKLETLNTRDIFASAFEAQQQKEAGRGKDEKRTKQKNKKKKQQQEKEFIGAMIEKPKVPQLLPRVNRPLLKSLDGLVTMNAKRVRQDDRPSRKISNSVPLSYPNDIITSTQSSKGDNLWPIAQNGVTDRVVEANTIFLNEQTKRLELALSRYHERSRKERANRWEKKDNGKREKNNNNKKRQKKDRKSQAGKLHKEPPGVNL